MGEETEAKKDALSTERRVLKSIGLSAWSVIAFLLANFIIGIVIAILIAVNVINATALDNAAFITSLTAAVFVLTLVIVIGVPYKIRGSRTTKKELGLNRLPEWYDLLWAPVSFVAYSILAVIILQVVSLIYPSFNADEAQEIGFENLVAYYEYILAFITLVVIAPIAEEIIFRGYLYGKLRKYVHVISAALLSSIVFAALHLNFDIDYSKIEGFSLSISQWNVALNVLPLAIMLAVLREKTGSIWAGILLHAIKNGIAFYLLFINPSIIDTMVR